MCQILAQITEFVFWRMGGVLKVPGWSFRATRCSFERMATSSHHRRPAASFGLPPIIETPFLGPLLRRRRHASRTHLLQDGATHLEGCASREFTSDPRNSSVLSDSYQLSARWTHWSISQISDNPRLLVALGVAGLLYGIGHAASALVIGLLAKNLALPEPAVPEQMGRLVSLCLLGILAVSCKAVGSIGLARGQCRAAGIVGIALRDRLAAALIASGTVRPSSDALAKLAVGVREVESAFLGGVLSQARAALQLVPLAIALILVSPFLAIGGVLAMLPFAVLLALVRRRWKTASSRAHAVAEQLHSGVDELIGNLDLWRTYGAGARIRGAIQAAGQRAVSASSGVESSRAALSSGNELLGALSLLAIVLVAPRFGPLLADGRLLEFSAVFFMTYRPLRDLGDARAQLGRGHAAAKSLEQLVGRVPWDRKWDMTLRQEQTPRHSVHGLDHLLVEDVGSARGGPRTTFEVRPGSLVCVVGPTGSGKTTLLRLLLGLEPAVGCVIYGGKHLSGSVEPESRPFGWVPQEAPLVTGTLNENLTLFGATPDAARQALVDWGGTELELRAGSSIIGPGGRPLSGGERRQVSLARAWASGPPVLLIDEPTEGLDERSARSVIAALERARGKRSLVVVTHSPEVWAVADQIVHIGNAAAARSQNAENAAASPELYASGGV